jgi:6-pyruvoyltetrahydropterin/6-carboxytetrahydropterin synthase
MGNLANWRLRRVVEIDAAHYLPEHPGKCANMHGHRWKVTIEVVSGALNAQGMVVDFGDLKFAAEALDHSVINDVPYFAEPDAPPPTAEHIARYLAQQVAALPDIKWSTIRVTVEETPGAQVTYEMRPWDEPGYDERLAAWTASTGGGRDD